MMIPPDHIGEEAAQRNLPGADEIVHAGEEKAAVEGSASVQMVSMETMVADEAEEVVGGMRTETEDDEEAEEDTRTNLSKKSRNYSKTTATCTR